MVIGTNQHDNSALEDFNTNNLELTQVWGVPEAVVVAASLAAVMEEV